VGPREAGGANSRGTAFKIAKTPGSCANTPTALVDFVGNNGQTHLVVRSPGAAENLFGATLSANSVSAAFELSGTGIQVTRARPPKHRFDGNGHSGLLSQNKLHL
jgi:hypothetical protein